MIDFAQWWLDEQTSFRQLSEIYKAEEFMGPRAAHMRNEKEPPSRLLFRSSHSCPSPLTLPAAPGMPTVSGDAVEPHIFSQRRLNVVQSCGPPVESMECVITSTESFQNPEGQAERCPCKGMPCLSAPSSGSDLRRIDSCEDSGSV